MTEWKEYKLEEIVETFIDYRGKTPQKSSSGIPLITAKVVKDGRIMPPNEFIPEEDYESWMTRGLPEINDIVLTTEAPLGEVALIKDNKIALAQRIITIRGKRDVVDNAYLKYYFQSSQGQFELMSRASGTTVFGIKAEVLRKVPVSLPPLGEQKRIASILTSLDDKIDLLRCENATLEAMAETLFRQWFVVEAKEEWEEGKLGDILSVKGGTTPSTKEPSYWDGDIAWTSPRDVTTLNGLYLFDTEKKITQKGLEQISSGLLPEGTLLMSSRAPVGVLAFAEIPLAINQGYIAILDDKGYSKEFIYLWLKTNMDLVHSYSNGSTFMEISKSAFKSLDLLIPPQSEVEEFVGKVKPYFEKIRLNEMHCILLFKLKNLLLPRLMSNKKC